LSEPGPAAPVPLVLPAALLDQAREIFEGKGAEGCEGTALIAAGPVGVRLVVPDQQPHRTRFGVSVEVTAQGQRELATALDLDELFVARIHSHPGEAFHSAADDANPVLTHTGALSVVVPFFGLGLRHGLDACAVLRHDGRGWRDVPPGPVRDQWITVDSRTPRRPA
jgi:hypothetical protein